MEFLSEYGMFLAKSATIVVVVMMIVGIVVGAGQKVKPAALKVTRLNDKYKKLKNQISEVVLDKKALKSLKKEEKALDKKDDKEEAKKRVYVLDFNGDIKASQAEQMRDEISALLTMATPEDEVVIKVESGGGMVHQYGLAASQLDRIKAKNIPLTVCVDRVAASGGYMMAVVADKIVAAPFAILGSIGVVAQLPNFNRLLKKNDIDFEVHTAGEYKRTLTLFGENTDKAREKFQDDLKEVHVLFKDFVSGHRSSVDVDKVANGDIWYGQKALEMNLADEIKTSDQYLQEKCEVADVYMITSPKKKSLVEKLSKGTESTLTKALENVLTKSMFQKWFV